MKKKSWHRIILPSGATARVRSDIKPKTLKALDEMMNCLKRSIKAGTFPKKGVGSMREQMALVLAPDASGNGG